jgi:hypothetical protein
MSKSALRFVQRVGNFRYFRKVGCKRIRLPGEEGSPEFNAAYERALRGKPLSSRLVGQLSRQSPRQDRSDG